LRKSPVENFSDKNPKSRTIRNVESKCKGAAIKGEISNTSHTASMNKGLNGIVDQKPFKCGEVGQIDGEVFSQPMHSLCYLSNAVSEFVYRKAWDQFFATVKHCKQQDEFVTPRRLGRLEIAEEVPLGRPYDPLCAREPTHTLDKSKPGSFTIAAQIKPGMVNFDCPRTDSISLLEIAIKILHELFSPRTS